MSTQEDMKDNHDSCIDDDSNTPKDEVQEISTNDYFHTEDIWNTDILLLTNGNQHKPGIMYTEKITQRWHSNSTHQAN